LQAERRDQAQPASLGGDPSDCAGVRQASLQRSHLLVVFEGSADVLIKAMAKYGVRSIRSHDDDLEEIFLRYYRDDA
jgi:hypothetical protein